MTKLYRKRVWLNKSLTLPAHIISYVHAFEDSFDAAIDIADCSRSISLDFSVYKSTKTEAIFKDRIAKIDKLLIVLTETRKAMIEAKAKIDAAKKKEKK